MYRLQFEDKCLKQLSKLDKSLQKIIWKWIETNLRDVEDPRSKGKALKGNRKELWRYRIGNYRLLVYIFDEELVVVAVEIGHRKDIYDK